MSKFTKFLFPVFIGLENNESLKNLMTLVHGDAKLDNFLFRKVKEQLDETYSSMLIDWQGCGFDLVSNDLMWCLYGFVKNLPETGDMIHGFVEFSVETYWDKLREVLGAFGDKFKDFHLPESSDDGIGLIKEGFTFEFMKNALIRPVLSLKNRKSLMRWWRKKERGEQAPLPKLTDVFKSESYVNFIFLYFKIATEINVFSNLASSLLALVKDSILNGIKNVEEDIESESEDDDEEIDQSLVPNNVYQNGVNECEKLDLNIEKVSIVTDILHEVFNEALKRAGLAGEPKTVTSLYGKVYTLKPSIKSL